MIISRLNIKGLSSSETTNPDLSSGISYCKGEKVLVDFGIVSKKSLKKLDITSDVFYADFDWDLIVKSVRNNKISYTEVPKFPSVRRDLSMLLNKEVTFEQLKQIAQKTDKSLLKEVNVFDVYIMIYYPMISYERYEQILKFLNSESNSELTYNEKILSLSSKNLISEPSLK